MTTPTFRVDCRTCDDDPDTDWPGPLETADATYAVLEYGEHRHERGHDAEVGVAPT